MIPIVFSTDHNYIMQTGICILSLLKSANNSFYDIYIIISDNVTDGDKISIINQVAKYNGHKINFINAGNEFDNGFEIRGITTAAYYRLLIPWLLPKYDKVIYSDVDVIFKTSLQDVYDIDINEYYVGAIQSAYFKFDEKAAEYTIKLNIDPNDYYNSGFLLINSKKQRNDNMRDEILKYSNIKFKYQDQDIINLVFKDKIKSLSPRYCITPAFYTQCIVNNPNNLIFYGSKKDIDDFLSGKNCILHYAGNKPWNSFTFGFTEWWDTYRDSIYYDCNFELNKFNRILSPKVTFSSIINNLKVFLSGLIRTYLKA